MLRVSNSLLFNEGELRKDFTKPFWTSKKLLIEFSNDSLEEAPELAIAKLSILVSKTSSAYFVNPIISVK